MSHTITYDRQEAFNDLLKRVEADKKLPFYEFNKTNDYKVVLGRGSIFPRVMFIGEAPGKQEAETGKPFVGRSGKLLDELLLSVDLTHNDIFISNTVFRRPPANRDPLPEEIDAYSCYFNELLELIQPKLICTLGRHALNTIRTKFDIKDVSTISTVVGRRAYKYRLMGEDLFIIPLYHPAVGLYSPSKKDSLFQHIKILHEYL